LVTSHAAVNAFGFIPQRQQRLVEAWAELHGEELLADWALLEQGRKPSPIF